MATDEAVFDVPPDAVFAGLSDPGASASFVVGARRVRHFDPSWPDVGSALHHSLGGGPLVLRYRTEVVEVEPGRRLVLRAQVRPFGVNHVTFVLTPVDGGTRVRVEEHPVEGPAAALWKPVSEAMMSLRNRELLRRLRVVTARRLQRQAEVGAR
jgi:uncharacterized protein YndB with AHSA1/START domain